MSKNTKLVQQESKQEIVKSYLDRHLQHENPFDATQLSLSDFYEIPPAERVRKKPEPKPEVGVIQYLYENATNTAGSVVLSAAAQPFLSTAFNANLAKLSGLTYWQGLKNMFNMPLAYNTMQGKNMFKYRCYTSILPSVVSSNEAETWVESFFAYSFAETAAAIGMFKGKEPNALFHAINAKKYCFMDSRGNGVNLSTITRSEFNKYCWLDQRTENFGDEEWEKLQSRLKTCKENWPYQRAMMLCRNVPFALSAFAARPLAKDIVEEYGDNIERLHGLKKDDQESVITYGARTAFAALTAPFQRALAMMSKGNRTGPQVLKKIGTEILEGHSLNSFRGAGGRMVFSVIAASTVGEGPRLGLWFRGKVNEFVDFLIPEKKKDVPEKESPALKKQNTVIPNPPPVISNPPPVISNEVRDLMSLEEKPPEKLPETPVPKTEVKKEEKTEEKLPTPNTLPTASINPLLVSQLKETKSQQIGR